jgi:hypothetical protein
VVVRVHSGALWKAPFCGAFLFVDRSYRGDCCSGPGRVANASVFYVSFCCQGDGHRAARWARPSVAWSKFTDLHCKTLKTSSRSSAEVLCTFHESSSPSEGNPDSFWDVDLRHTSRGWLIYSYCQG